MFILLGSCSEWAVTVFFLSAESIRASKFNAPHLFYSVAANSEIIVSKNNLILNQFHSATVCLLQQWNRLKLFSSRCYWFVFVTGGWGGTQEVRLMMEMFRMALGFFVFFLLGAGLMSASARQIRHGETLRGGSEANLAPTSTVTSWKYKQGNNWCRIFQSCLRRRRVWRCLLHSPNRTLCYFQLFECRHSLWSGRGLSVIRPN